MIFNINNSIHNYKTKQEDKIQKEISSISDNLILKTDETTLFKKLKETYKINHITIEIDKIKIISSEENIFFEEDDLRDEYYEQPSILFNKNEELILKIPYLGDKELFEYCPTSYILPKNFIKITNKYVIFKVIFQKNNTNSAKLEIDNYCNYLITMVENLNKNIDTINNNLDNFIEKQITYRKKELNEKNKFLDELNIPLSKPEDTLNNTKEIIPFNIKNNISVKDINSKTKSYSLNYDTYNQILKTIYKYCVNIEQKSLSKDKNEEEIRDLILAHLNSITDDASVTGESFNNKGKTDILIRYEEKNLFIGECKIWHGKQIYLKAIDQVLSYLTWRDTLASIIIFVRKENMENITSKIQEYTKKHPNYVNIIEQKDKTWFNYKFYLDLEYKDEVYLAVQIFKTP